MEVLLRDRANWLTFEGGRRGAGCTGHQGFPVRLLHRPNEPEQRAVALERIIVQPEPAQGRQPLEASLRNGLNLVAVQIAVDLGEVGERDYWRRSGQSAMSIKSGNSLSREAVTIFIVPKATVDGFGGHGIGSVQVQINSRYYFGAVFVRFSRYGETIYQLPVLAFEC